MSYYEGSVLSINTNINGITKIDNELDYQSDNPLSNKGVAEAINNAIPKCRVGVVWCESGTPNFDVENKTFTLPAGTKLIIGDELISNIETDVSIGYADDLQGNECPNGFIVYNIENELYINIPVTDVVAEKHVLIGAYSNYGESAYVFGNYTINGTTPIADGSVTNDKLGADIIRNQEARVIIGSGGKKVNCLVVKSTTTVNNEMVPYITACRITIPAPSYLVYGQNKKFNNITKIIDLETTPGLQSITEGVPNYDLIQGFITYNIDTDKIVAHALTDDIPDNELYMGCYYFNANATANYVFEFNGFVTKSGNFFTE